MKKFFLLSIILSSSCIAMEEQKKDEQFFPDEPTEKIEFRQGLLGMASENHFRRYYGSAPKIFERLGDTIIEKKLGKDVLEFYKKNPDNECSGVFKRYAMAVAYRLQESHNARTDNGVSDEELKRAESIVPFNHYELNFIEYGQYGKDENLMAVRRKYLNEKLQELKKRVVKK